MEPDALTTVAMSDDTICAISTPPGVGGIAVARISGPQAIEITSRIWRGRPLGDMPGHTARLGTVTDTRGEPLDQALATVFRTPSSFTGQNTVELSVHGSRYVQSELLASLIKAGCRLAQPGEFTRRAFAAGNLDLAQAEAVADIIASSSRAAHRLAISQMRGSLSTRIASLRDSLLNLASLLELELDFSEEDVEFADRTELLRLATEVNAEVTRLRDTYRNGRAIKEGVPTAIVGPTNAGKSSLLNLLAGDDRAIVSDIHGTTRDTIEEAVTIGDYLYRFIDTAGLRPTTDTIERIGQQRSLQAISRARIVLALADSTAPFDPATLAPAIDALRGPMPPAADALDRSEGPAVSVDTLRSPEAPATDAMRSPERPVGFMQSPDAPTVIVVLNKTDLPPHPGTPEQVSAFAATHGLPLCSISAKTGEDLPHLITLLNNIVAADSASAHEDTVMVTNARHAALLDEAARSSRLVIDGLNAGLSGDLIAQDLRHTLTLLSSITGEIPSSEILATIFSRFCIGK